MSLVSDGAGRFFYATPQEGEQVLTAADGALLEFVEEPEAEEWHQSVNARRQAGIDNRDPLATAAVLQYTA